MYIIHGTTIKFKKLGIVANFCPICHEIRPFQVLRVGLASHIYYISFGQGKLKEHRMECQVCKIQLLTDPLSYATMEKSRAHLQDIESLILATYPKLREVYAGRLDFEEQLKKSPHAVAPESRARYMLEPFRLINPSVESRYKGSTRFDKQSGLGCIGTLVGFFALTTLSLTIFERTKWSDPTMFAAVGVAVLGVIYTIVQLALGPGRYLRNQLMPKLTRALRPFDPAREELGGILEKCKTSDMLIGKKVKLDQLQAELLKTPQ